MASREVPTAEICYDPNEVAKLILFEIQVTIHIDMNWRRFEFEVIELNCIKPFINEQ